MIRSENKNSLRHEAEHQTETVSVSRRGRSQNINILKMEVWLYEMLLID